MTHTDAARLDRSYSKFAFACCRLCPVLILLWFIVVILAPTDSWLSTFALILAAGTGGFLFLVLGGLSALAGIVLYLRRWKTSKVGAYVGLCAGILFGILVTFVAITAVVAVLTN